VTPTLPRGASGAPGKGQRRASAAHAARAARACAEAAAAVPAAAGSTAAAYRNMPSMIGPRRGGVRAIFRAGLGWALATLLVAGYTGLTRRQ
jgi:hypothetical protein